jgi:hypothetical protein
MQAADPLAGKPTRVVDPRQDRWEQHFAPELSLGQVRGLTAIGRATVEALALNHPERAATRRLWAAAGWRP